jgi:hypothetical protein
MNFLRPGCYIRRLDALVQRGVERFQRLLRWTAGDRARTWARWLALIAATPAIMSSLPLAAAVIVLALVVALNLLHARSTGDQTSLIDGLSALLRLLLIAGALLGAIAFLLVPSLITGSIAAAAGLIATEGYLHDLD